MIRWQAHALLPLLPPRTRRQSRSPAAAAAPASPGHAETAGGHVVGSTKQKQTRSKLAKTIAACQFCAARPVGADSGGGWWVAGGTPFPLLTMLPCSFPAHTCLSPLPPRPQHNNHTPSSPRFDSRHNDKQTVKPSSFEPHSARGKHLLLRHAFSLGRVRWQPEPRPPHHLFDSAWRVKTDLYKPPPWHVQGWNSAIARSVP